jgi:hypothetical protein
LGLTINGQIQQNLNSFAAATGEIDNLTVNTSFSALCNLNIGANYIGRDSDNNFDFSTDNITGIKIDNAEIGTFNAYGLGIREASTANYIINARYDQNGATCIRAYNDTSSGAAASYCVSETSSNVGVLASLSAGWTTSNMKVADSVCLYSENASEGLRLFTLDSNSLYLGTNNTVGMTMDTSQNSAFSGNLVVTGKNITSGATAPALHVYRHASDYSGAGGGEVDMESLDYSNEMIRCGRGAYGDGLYNIIGFGYYVESTYDATPAYIGALGKSSSGGGAYALVFGTRSVTTNTAATERLRIETNGNIGLSNSDVENWHSDFRAIESTTSAISFSATSTPYLNCITNTYYDGVWKYKSTDKATRIANTDGGIYLQTAASGTANTTVNWVNNIIVSGGNTLFGTSNFESWNNSYTALQIGGAGNIFTETTAGSAGWVNVTNNAYYDSSGWKYQNTWATSAYTQQSGKHIFRVAGSGTADTAITFTDAVIIDNSHNVLINESTAETNSQGAISIKQGTDPTTSTADQMSIFATAGADCTLGLRTEASINSETPSPDRTLVINVNGALYKVNLTYVSGE